MTAKVRPIGSLKASPLVCTTTDVHRFLTQYLGEKPTIQRVAERARISQESAKKIMRQDSPTVSLEVADQIAVSFGRVDALNTEMPVYRAAHMNEKEYLKFMRQAGCDKEWALSIPEIP